MAAGADDALIVTRVAGSRPELAWSTPWQAVVLICRGATFRTGSRIALVVGTLLTAVNQGTVLASGHAGAATIFRVVANYLIPYVVSSLGYLAPFRVRRPGPVAEPGAGEAPAGD